MRKAMSMSSFESQIWRQLQRILNNPRMRKKDLLEWSSGDVTPGDGEIAIRVDALGVNAVVRAELDLRVEG